MKSFRNRLTCIRDLADRYDYFLVDQWGVLHDGQSVYPGVLDCLQHLQQRGKKVILLSNSGKPALANGPRLEQFGIDNSCYTRLITSGDLARSLLETRHAPFTPELGRRYLLLNIDDYHSLVEGLDLEAVASVREADFILLTGVRDDRDGLFYQDILD
ncbi:MAG: hypothetical protein ACR2HF_08400, partial [Methylococcaceae bacterium]